jgi:Arc/MetJ-type ribon-helix-helix transcriptional regulator
MPEAKQPAPPEQERHVRLVELRAALREGEESGEADDWDVERFLAESPSGDGAEPQSQI